MLPEERAHLHVLPTESFTPALGETRMVRDDQTIRFGSVRYSTPRTFVGKEVWCRVEGEELGGGRPGDQRAHEGRPPRPVDAGPAGDRG
jgi:hypothetical protein